MWVRSSICAAAGSAFTWRGRRPRRVIVGRPSVRLSLPPLSCPHVFATDRQRWMRRFGPSSASQHYDVRFGRWCWPRGSQRSRVRPCDRRCPGPASFPHTLWHVPAAASRGLYSFDGSAVGLSESSVGRRRLLHRGPRPTDATRLRPDRIFTPTVVCDYDIVPSRSTTDSIRSAARSCARHRAIAVRPLRLTTLRTRLYRTTALVAPLLRADLLLDHPFFFPSSLSFRHTLYATVDRPPHAGSERSPLRIEHLHPRPHAA